MFLGKLWLNLLRTSAVAHEGIHQYLASSPKASNKVPTTLSSGPAISCVFESAMFCNGDFNFELVALKWEVGSHSKYLNFRIAPISASTTVWIRRTGILLLRFPRHGYPDLEGRLWKEAQVLVEKEELIHYLLSGQQWPKALRRSSIKKERKSVLSCWTKTRKSYNFISSWKIWVFSMNN